MIVDFYEQVGYLPDAIINYLVLLGWSLDDKTEFFTREEMIANFSLERVDQGAGQLRSQKAVVVPGSLHAGSCRSSRRWPTMLPLSCSRPAWCRRRRRAKSARS